MSDLISSPQLDLFHSRLPKRPYCCDMFFGLRIRDRPRALRMRYIQVNAPWLRSWLVFDLDRPGAAVAWEDALLPEPIWTAQNPINGHAHSAWGLDAPVLLGQHDRQQPMRYLAAVEAAMRTKLRADEGYAGLLTKNPVHRDWRTLWSSSAGIYDLGYLSDHLDLPRFVDRRRRPEQVGLGRNVTLFDYLRHYAYRAIRTWKIQDHKAYVRWQCHLYGIALKRNGDFQYPLDATECHHIAKSISRWVWTKFNIQASDERFRALQSARGRRGGRPRMDDKRASAQVMRAQGMTQKAIAEALGVTERSVRNWISDNSDRKKAIIR